ncbi:villin-like protein isoform X2 [Tachyglossus aculeatus]|nr:villin-like protein isoform X2 [Tachyglossus aculeatus]
MADPDTGLPNIEDKPGLQIWTIEKMKMVPIPEKSYGSFFEGDCYIILHNKQTSRGASRDIHYWIGKDSSQDEQGAAAIYITLLDDALGGCPVQHREVQGYESEVFKSYFKKAVIYKKGGHSSGFKNVELDSIFNMKRLLHVKGKKHVSATEVELSWNSFNKGDVFLLDLGKLLIQWNGPQSNVAEKSKGLALARSIRDGERSGRAQISVVNDEASARELLLIMETVLGPRPRQLREAVPAPQVDLLQKGNVRLYRVFEKGENLVVQELAMRPLTQDLLQHEDCHILDQGGFKIYVWRGRASSTMEKRAAFSRAVGFIQAKGYSPSTNVEVVNDGAEPAMFKQLFQRWMDRDETQAPGRAYSQGRLAKMESVKFDASQLHAHPELAAEQRMVDDGSGTVEVWRLEDLHLKAVEARTHGQFYDGYCYLVLYSYWKSGHLCYILYSWQGRHASRDEIAALAVEAADLDRRYQEEPVHVRITVGKEPRHFLAIFGGRLIVYKGGASRDGKKGLDPAIRLFQVRSMDNGHSRTMEVPARASALNSNDVFILQTGQVGYLWCGKGCSGDERETAKVVADTLSQLDKLTMLEGQEPSHFWEALGGRAPYASDKRVQELKVQYQPRLFECSNQTGRFIMTEMVNFCQEDLDEGDVMLLDTWEEIFLWIGKASNTYERNESLTSAQEYLKTHPAGRDPATPIITVKQGHEPLTFSGWFIAWDPYKWREIKSIEETKNSLGDLLAISEMTMGHGGGGGSCSGCGGSSSDSSNGSYFSGNSNCDLLPCGSFHREDLVNKSVEELPEGVDPTRKEFYLSNSDFLMVFGKSKSEFYQMPLWKQQIEKKQLGFF